MIGRPPGALLNVTLVPVPTLFRTGLVAGANVLGLAQQDPALAAEAARRAKGRVGADEHSAGASGVMITPTFFINGRRYDGPWDKSSLSDAMLGRLGHRVRAAALAFASWGPSAGVLLLDRKSTRLNSSH